MGKIIPTVFATNKGVFMQKFKDLVKISREIQIDFMDGKFVHSKGIGIGDIPDLRKYKNKFEAHLMVRNPEDWISEIKKKGFDKVIFHVEANPRHIGMIIDRIKKSKMEVWLALNPETSISAIIPHVHSVSGILFMGVHPGKEHQDFIPEVLQKIKELKNFNRKIQVQVDGGVNEDVAKKLRQIEVDIVNTGSFVSDADNPKKALEKLEKVFS